MTTTVPPIKCQGIKTKIVPLIKECAPIPLEGYWIEPFCGSCVVALNIQPNKAILADTNKHIINLYRGIQDNTINANIVKSFLEQEGAILYERGEDYYYEVRARFNEKGDTLDFLFLNRACFNGVMRFNRYGKFNVPYNHKPDRFRQAYITKITNQIKAFSEVVRNKDWRFEIATFDDTLAKVDKNDVVYVDPPYIGRHVDYFNYWSDENEALLIKLLKNVRGKFLLSTWHSNKYRRNPAIDQHWQENSYYIRTVEHFYHVGATEDLRNSMTEALIVNYELSEAIEEELVLEQQELEL